MAHVAHALAGASYEFDGFQAKLKYYAKTLFLKFVESRMETARTRIALMKH